MVTSLVMAPLAEGAERKRVDSDYTLLRRSPSSYVLGTAYHDWMVDVQQETSGAYQWGRVHGDLNTCLWVFAGALAGGGPVADTCDHDHRVIPESEFSSKIGGGTDDGEDVTLRRDPVACPSYDGFHVTGYGNVRPWQATTQATSSVKSEVALGATVKWRYVSRDGRWVMVHTPGQGKTDGQGVQSWLFLPRSCVPV
jgi:hypothetical protein